MNLVATIQERMQGLLPDTLGIQFIEVAPEKVLASLDSGGQVEQDQFGNHGFSVKTVG